MRPADAYDEWTTAQTYLLTKRFNRVFSLSLRTRDQWAAASGSPCVKPNVQHNGTIDVLADFKIDTNNLHEHPPAPGRRLKRSES
jgi:hypothetical protein